MLIEGFPPDSDIHDEVAVIEQHEREEQHYDLSFSLYNPVAHSLQTLTWIQSDTWISMVTRVGVNTTFMTFPMCHGKILEKINNTQVEAYDIWMLNQLTHIYEPVSVWVRKGRSENALIRDWVKDCFDYWFERGEGMIGKVGAREEWHPNKKQTLGEDDSFLRHSNAQKVGLKRGDAIWFPFHTHRFVLGYYTSDNYIDESLRTTILNGTPRKNSNAPSLNHAVSMDVDDDPNPTPSRICIEDFEEIF